MPYIKKEKRLNIKSPYEVAGILHDRISDLSFVIESDGDLNYVISELMINHALFKDGFKPIGYQSLKDTWTTALDAALEFRDRVQSHYEVFKQNKNGDIYKELIDAITEQESK